MLTPAGPQEMPTKIKTGSGLRNRRPRPSQIRRRKRVGRPREKSWSSGTRGGDPKSRMTASVGTSAVGRIGTVTVGLAASRRLAAAPETSEFIDPPNACRYGIMHLDPLRPTCREKPLPRSRRDVHEASQSLPPPPRLGLEEMLMSCKC